MPSHITTINPKNGSLLKTYPHMSDGEVRHVLDESRRAGASWRQLAVDTRLGLVAALAERLIAQAPRLGRLATEEMGKPLAQAIKEVEKCAVACRYYVEHAARFLADEPVATGAVKSYITYRPLGPVLCIMPWNFPYWQVIRFAVPALVAGNTVILKHAENVTGVALEIGGLLAHAGFPDGVFQVLRLEHKRLQDVIQDDLVQAVSLTGSDRAGRAVAAAAGASLKKVVLELGGSDPYIVLRDADIEHAASVCLDARLVNGGQSCVAAKRFIIEDAVYDRFVEAFVAKARTKTVGDPLAPTTDVGPLAKLGIRDDVARQVAASTAMGARILLGGATPEGAGCYYPVTVLDGVAAGMPAFDEEVFGPVAALVRAKDCETALALANRSRFGLGGAIFSADVQRAEELAAQRLDVGMVAINGMVQSDPRLPFGGVRQSGYGRELSWVGLREFVNVKTIVVNEPPRT